MTRSYWLMKSEPDEVSVDDVLAMPHQTVAWFGVRNYQARNFMRDAMQIGDGVLFYHSSCPEPGIAGIGVVASAPRADETQFQVQSPYFDPKSTPTHPRWVLVDVQVERKIPLISLAQLRQNPALAGMLVLAKGNRLSITPVDALHWTTILNEVHSFG